MQSSRHIERNGYFAMAWSHDQDVSIVTLWQRFPQLVVGKHLVNTSWDSGFLTLTASQLAEGWFMVGRHAHSPLIGSTDQIPHDHYDEWLVFDRPVHISEFETMVNYLDFSPVDYDWAEKVERFWEQVVRLAPDSVLGSNDGTYLVTRDPQIIKSLQED